MKIVTCILFVFTLQSFAQELKFEKTNGKDSLHLGLINYLDTSVDFDITPIDSLKNQIRVRKHFYISPKDTAKQVISIPYTLLKDSTVTDIYKFVNLYYDLGNPNEIQPDENYLYALPFPKGKKYRVTQSFGGKFSHHSEKSKYAIDFNLKVGDTVCAARGGIVIRTKDHFKEHGGKDFIKKANLIIIQHSDGTLASYVHLDCKGVFVAPGTKVTKGQPIGISGFTGFARGPHLHFVVRKARSVAIPIYFEGYKGKKLKRRRKYTH